MFSKKRSRDNNVEYDDNLNESESKVKAEEEQEDEDNIRQRSSGDRW